MTPRSSILALLTALAVLAVATASASAFTALITSGGAISSASLGNLTFEGGLSLACPMTLNGLLFRGPITIARGNEIGRYSEVRINNERCSGGSIRQALASPVEPWPITINSVPAGLPNEASSLELLIANVAVQFSAFGGFVECLYRGNVLGNLQLIKTRTAGVYTTGLMLILPNSLRLVEGGFGCPPETTVRGILGMTTQTITIR